MSNSSDIKVCIGETVVTVTCIDEGFNAMVVINLENAKVLDIQVKDCSLGNLKKLLRVATETVIDIKVGEAGRYMN
ncbi:hypothetical protein SBP8a_146 [Bacillus phage SBP8a]|nr:hypothetical protein SBP8a_146 [Bacillus phage SBP8a]